MDLSTGLTITRRMRSGGYVAPPTGPVAAVLAITPAARWHAGLATVTQGGGRVLTATALNGPGVTAGAEGLGPLMRTDALGRAYWAFTGAEYLDVGAGLTFNNRAMAVFAVGRGLAQVFGPGNRTGYGAGSTAVNTGGPALSTVTMSGTASVPVVFSRTPLADAANRHKVISGAQFSVRGAVARDTASNGGCRIYVNTDFADTFQQASIAASGVVGAEIGRSPFSPGASGAWSGMQLYELVIYNRVLTNAEADGVAAALTAHWQVPQITSQLVLEGDSISAGIGLGAGERAGEVLTLPGSSFVPAHYRVSSYAISGNSMVQLLERRDTATGWPEMLLPGRNVMAFEIGRNDLSGITDAQHYANVVAYLNSAGTGLLQRGWEARVICNIATGSVLTARYATLRAMYLDPQFLTDTLSGPGQAHEGRVSVVRTDLVTKAPSGTLFATTADAADTLYYQGDVTHLTAVGTAARATGADTPQHGIAYGLT